MRIIQIIDSFWLGGAQSLQVTFAREALKRGLDLTVISLGQPKNTEVEAELTCLGVPPVYLPGSGLLDLGRFKRLLHFLRESRANVIQTHLGYSNILGCLAAAIAGIPAVATLHNTDTETGLGERLKTALETLVLNLAAQRVVAVGYQVMQTQSGRFKPPKLVAVPNAVEMVADLTDEERQALRQEMTGDPQRTILITAGRIARQKGLPNLLESFAEVRQRLPQAALVIVGDGLERDRVAARADELGLQDDLFMLGTRQDVRRLMSASDAYVSASLWEGLPIAVLEAMAAGLPVVATCVGDLSYVVAPDTGCLVPPGKPGEMADTLLGLLQEPDRMREMGQAGRKRVMESYLPGPWVNHLMDVYKQASLAAGQPWHGMGGING